MTNISMHTLILIPTSKSYYLKSKKPNLIHILTPQYDYQNALNGDIVQSTNTFPIKYALQQP